MQKRRTLAMFGWALALSFLFLAARGAFAAPQAGGYHVIRRIPVGGEGNWDYLRVDPDAKRIYLSRGTHMMVVDETSGKVIGDLPDTKGIHGVALAPELNKGFTSNGGDQSVTVFDLKTIKPITVIKVTGENPDSIIYDPQSKRVFTFNGRSSNATAIDATTNKVVGTVMLNGKPEEPALDGRGNMFVNLEDKSSILEFDTKTLAVKGSWPLAPCEGPSALAYDSAHHRLFAACDKILAVVNADTGKVVASPPIGGDPDGDGFDPGTGMVFAACREGLVSVLHEDSPDKYSAVGNITTQFGTRTMTLDPKTHHVFTVTADFKAAAAPTPDNPRPRPQPIENSFVILELGQ
jgi:DNA-binding beta-propeller fold protein YncE